MLLFAVFSIIFLHNTKNQKFCIDGKDNKKSRKIDIKNKHFHNILASFHWIFKYWLESVYMAIITEI